MNHPIAYEDRIGENRCFLCIRIFTKHSSVRNAGDFYLEQIGGK